MAASVILFLLGILEIFAGVIVYFHYFPILEFFLWLGLIYTLKGAWSIVSSVAYSYWYDWMGVLDLLAGLVMILIFYGNIFSFFWIVGLAHIMKGLYTVVVSI